MFEEARFFVPMQITFTPIGLIHSPFTDLADMPIQPASENSAPGTVEVFPLFAAGLKDLAGFSHIYLIYYLHKAKPAELVVTPFLDKESHGVFATRAPSRPNGIGLSLVRLLGVSGNILHVGDLDVLDGTPLLDIKPYVPAFEGTTGVRTGWLDQREETIRGQRSDDRFSAGSGDKADRDAGGCKPPSDP